MPRTKSKWILTILMVYAVLSLRAPGSDIDLATPIKPRWLTLLINKFLKRCHDTATKKLVVENELYDTKINHFSVARSVVFNVLVCCSSVRGSWVGAPLGFVTRC